ncbi:MAG: hypothetical protein WAN64_18410, partial [Pseudolabrys sp.]
SGACARTIMGIAITPTPTATVATAWRRVTGLSVFFPDIVRLANCRSYFDSSGGYRAGLN